LVRQRRAAETDVDLDLVSHPAQQRREANANAFIFLVRNDLFRFALGRHKDHAVVWVLGERRWSVRRFRPGIFG
jgi:hypothetical protein